MLIASEKNIERAEHPVDVVEQLAATNDWSFDRDDENEISISVAGGWTDYHVAFTWLEDLETLHVSCGFELRVPERRRAEVMALIAAINEQMWVGHFDLWPADGVAMHRYGLLLAGGAQPSGAQCTALLDTALKACERYYQAFQFVLWAGKSAREALDTATFETKGEA
ncbi:MAG: YbjN domain-containing protein [Methylocystis sp.]|nr:YbjN domain-containing protein [Methylocystis sp.]MBI3275451.1 YbjN domain-containing protein [Methylocystis sp.]